MVTHMKFTLSQKQRLTQRNKMAGVTLIELVIVTAIIGILGAVALPSFQSYAMSAKRGDAHHLLLVNETRLTKCLTLAGSYDNGCKLITTSKEGYYNLTSTLTIQTWTLSAVPVAGRSQANDTDCGTLTLTHIGVKSATGSSGANCW